MSAPEKSYQVQIVGANGTTILEPGAGNTDVAGILAALSFSRVGAHTTNTSLSSAVTLTPPTGAARVLLQAFERNLRYTLDGVAPTSSTGFQLAPGGDPLLIAITGTTAIKIIEETGGGVLAYQWGV